MPLEVREPHCGVDRTSTWPLAAHAPPRLRDVGPGGRTTSLYCSDEHLAVSVAYWILGMPVLCLFWFLGFLRFLVWLIPEFLADWR